MKIYSRVFVILALFCCVAVCAWQPWVHNRRNVTMSVTTAGDTAEVHTVTVKMTSDSGVFIDSVFFTNDTSQHVVCSVRTPLQAMIFTLAGNTGNLTKLDTVGIGVVGCTAVFAAQELGIEYDLSTGADSTIATALDSLVDIWNKATNLKDTINAQDSGTYIKLVSKFGEEKLTQRWSMKMTTDSTDTSSHTGMFSENDICDSLVAFINADDSASVYVTAAVATDTSTTFTITSNDPGVPIHSVSVTGSDTMSSAATQENVTSWSSVQDTFALGEPPGFAGSEWGGIQGRFLVESTLTTTKQGIGLKDSIYIQLWRKRFLGGTAVWDVLDADSCADSPCSLWVHHIDAAGTDTLLGEQLYLYVRVADSASDTTATILYPVLEDYDLQIDK